MVQNRISGPGELESGDIIRNGSSRSTKFRVLEVMPGDDDLFGDGPEVEVENLETGEEKTMSDLQVQGMVLHEE